MSTTTDYAAEGSLQVIYRGVKEISGFVGINPRRFVYYKDHHSLPVFKADASSKVWLATRGDLVGWVEDRKVEYKKRMERKKGAKNEPRNKQNNSAA